MSRTTPTPNKKTARADHKNGHATIAIDSVDAIYDITHALDAFALLLRDAPSGDESLYQLIRPHVQKLMAISDEIGGAR